MTHFPFSGPRWAWGGLCGASARLVAPPRPPPSARALGAPSRPPAGAPGPRRGPPHPPLRGHGARRGAAGGGAPERGVLKRPCRRREGRLGLVGRPFLVAELSAAVGPCHRVAGMHQPHTAHVTLTAASRTTSVFPIRTPPPWATVACPCHDSAGAHLRRRQRGAHVLVRLPLWLCTRYSQHSAGVTNNLAQGAAARCLSTARRHRLLPVRQLVRRLGGVVGGGGGRRRRRLRSMRLSRAAPLLVVVTVLSAQGSTGCCCLRQACCPAPARRHRGHARRHPREVLVEEPLRFPLGEEGCERSYLALAPLALSHPKL